MERRTLNKYGEMARDELLLAVDGLDLGAKAAGTVEWLLLMADSATLSGVAELVRVARIQVPGCFCSAVDR